MSTLCSGQGGGKRQAPGEEQKAPQGGSTMDALMACEVWQLWESAAEIMGVARDKEQAGARAHQLNTPSFHLA